MFDGCDSLRTRKLSVTDQLGNGGTLVSGAINFTPRVMNESAGSLPTCACRKSNPDILVVQPAENWAAKNLPGPFDGTRERRILLQG